MRLSIRNQLGGTVETVARGEVMSAVKVRLSGGSLVTAAITAEAAGDLGLAQGTAVDVLIKSTEVSVAIGAVDGVSIRNRLSGSVESLQHGEVMSAVKISLDDGSVLTAAITREAATDLGLVAGMPVTALIKSTEVGLAVV